MNVQDIITLAKAGFTAEQISGMLQTEQPEPQPAPDPKPEPEAAHSKPDPYERLMEELGAIKSQIQKNNISGSLFYDGAKVGSCSAVLRWAKANNLTVAKKDVQRGDIILFDWHVANGVPDHFGFALGSPEAGKIRTVEGNTEDMVAERLRNMTDVGYVIRPKYAASPGSDS